MRTIINEVDKYMEATQNEIDLGYSLLENLDENDNEY
jgi:hypothetical protein